MSGSAALEYGFPSTHSANAVSVAVYAILILRSASNSFTPAAALALEGLAYFYALSIVIGRLYCGMHGFFDVFIGSLLGATISFAEFYYGPSLDLWFQHSSYLAPLVVGGAIIALVRVHPEPADDCPCFDDSVAFAGVMIGLEAGTWRFGRHSAYSAIYWGPEASFNLVALGLPTAVARILSGVLVIFAWRELAKPTLLRVLPHLFRVIEIHGLDLPRRFFVPASEYISVPLRLRDDNVLPNVSDLPRLVNSFRGPTRGRSVSIGPQSAADAYETLAYRERRRRESAGSEAGVSSTLRERKTGGEDQAGRCEAASGVQNGGGRLAEMEALMGAGRAVVSPSPEMGEGGQAKPVDGKEEPGLYVGQRDELGEKEMFEKLVKPRVRYDVEVVTKLVVYTGIAWLAVDIIPTLFELVGWGAGHLPLR